LPPASPAAITASPDLSFLAWTCPRHWEVEEREREKRERKAKVRERDVVGTGAGENKKERKKAKIKREALDSPWGP